MFNRWTLLLCAIAFACIALVSCKKNAGERCEHALLGDALESAASGQRLRAMIQRRKMARSPGKPVRLIDRRIGIDYCEPALLAEVDKALAQPTR